MRAESTRRKDGLGGQKMKQNTYRIAENRALTESVWEMTLNGDTSACERPGQFVNIKLEGFFLRRPISVCDYDENTIKIIYKTVGAGTKEMSQMRQGQMLDVLTGLGNGYDTAKAGNMPLLIGGGAGVPPLYGLLRHLKKENPKCEAKVILGFNTQDEIFYKEEFEALGAEVFLTTADGSAGTKGFVTDVMKVRTYSCFYACGPEAMLKAIDAEAKTSGQLSFEERMGCGFGACMGCSCRTKYGNKRICKEGPVLEREEIIW